MKILVVSASFLPKLSPRSFRTTELVKELAVQGHQITLIIPRTDYDYTEFTNKYKVAIKFMRKRIFHEITVKGNNPIKRNFLRAIRRLFSILLEYPSIEYLFLVKRALRKEHNYSLLISIAVPHPIHWGVAWARSNKNRIASTWVADCGDPFMGNQTDTFKKMFYFKYFEKWFCRKCDYISIPNEILRNKYYKEFKDKIVVIPQGFQLKEIKIAHKQMHPVPTFGFAGSVIPGIRDFNAFFNFLRDQKYQFKFIIYTKQTEYFSNFKKYFDGQIEIHDYIPRLDLIYELSKCDFLVNIDTKMDNAAIPSKLIDYALTNRPILNLKSDHIDQEIILQFFLGNYTNQRIINIKTFQIESVVSKFLELCKAV